MPVLTHDPCRRKAQLQVIEYKVRLGMLGAVRRVHVWRNQRPVRDLT